MAITQAALARAIARDLVRTAPPEAGIKRIWVWSQHGYVDPELDVVALSVLVEPANEGAEHALLAAISQLADTHPEVKIGASTFAPGTYAEADLRAWLHPDAREIDLGPG